MVTLDGEDIALRAPEVVSANFAEGRVPEDLARRWHRQGIAHYLWLKSVTPAEAGVEPARLAAPYGFRFA